MDSMKNLKPILVFLTCTIYAPVYAQESLSVPAGFTVEKLNFSVPNARQMALSDNGTLVVGTRREGVVYAVPNALTDNPGEPIELLDDLRMPSGVTIHDGDLYVVLEQREVPIPISSILEVEASQPGMSNNAVYVAGALGAGALILTAISGSDLTNGRPRSNGGGFRK